MIVLDTHAWVWWFDSPGKLSRQAADAIDGATTLCVSAWSCWELATLVRRERLRLNRPVSEWLADARAGERLEVVAADQRIATLAGQLPDDFPGDPSDRAIYATALTRVAPLVTRDRKIREFDPTRTIW